MNNEIIIFENQNVKLEVSMKDEQYGLIESRWQIYSIEI